MQFDQNSVTGLDFSEDGKHLFSAGGEAVLGWDVATGSRLGAPLGLRGSSAQSFALSRVGSLAMAGRTSLTADEWRRYLVDGGPRPTCSVR